MYLWVVIATFITMLASYNLSVRPDIERAHAHTKANVEITKFLIHHETAVKYFGSINKTALTPGFSYPLKVEETNKGEGSSGSAPTSKFSDFLPFGLTEDPTVLSKAFCFPLKTSMGSGGETVTSTDYTKQCSGNGPDNDPSKSCCANNAGEVYLVSIKKVPSRWLTKTKDKDNDSGMVADFLATLKTTRDYARNMGYVTNNGKNLSGFEKDNSDGKEIYKGIYEDNDFKKMCIDNKCLYAFKKI